MCRNLQWTLAMKMSSKVRQQMKAKAHKLNPIVLIGHQGLTAAVNNEIDRGLYDHELIKIKINVEDREARKEILEQISKVHKAELIQRVGKVGVIYRKSDKYD
jgi:RNA-binding protein